MIKTRWRGAAAFWLWSASLFLTLSAGNAAQGQKKTARATKKSPAKITLRDLDYERFQAAHPSDAYFGLILPALSGGGTQKRSFRLAGQIAAAFPLVVRVTPVLYAGSAKPQALTAIEKKLPPSATPAQDFALDLPVPAPDANATLEFTLVVRQKDAPLCYLKESFLVVAAGKDGTTAQWLGRDDKTQGDWLGVYGKDGFLVATAGGRAAYQRPNIWLNRGLGDAGVANSRDVFDSRNVEEGVSLRYADGPSLADRRLPQYGPGMSETRPPVAFSAQRIPLIFRAEASDGLPHTLSLYALDYRRAGQILRLRVYDFQRHCLASRRIENFSEGTYLRYRFSGKIILVLTSDTPGMQPSVHALFADPGV